MTTLLAPPEPPPMDPDNVPETLCLGRYNVFVSGPLATLTFTHTRPKAAPLIEAGKIDPESIVRARVVVPAESLALLRDLLDRIIKEQVTTLSQGLTGRPN